MDGNSGSESATRAGTQILPEKTLDILVIGANLCNRGAESMLLTLISEIQLEIPDAKFSVWSYAHDDRKRAGTVVHSEPNGINATFKLSCNHKNLGLLFLQGLLCVAPFPVTSKIARNFSAFIRSVDQADAVVDISGFALAGDRPWWRHVIYLLEARTAHACGTPFLAMTQSFGPFRTFWNKTIARWALANARFISARGPMSARHLEAIGLSEGRDFIVAPDITYQFAAAPAGSAREILLESARPRIAVIPNTNVYYQSAAQSTGHGDGNAYVVTLARICHQAIVQHGCTLVFILHECYPSRFDDSSLVEIIRRDPTIKAHSIVLENSLSASMIKSVVLQCDAVITSRYHGMLAAFSGGIPAFVPGWADKYTESAEIAGTPEFTFKFAQSDPDSIVNHFTQFWETREHIRHTLLTRLPQNLADSKQSIGIMIEHLRRHSEQ